MNTAQGATLTATQLAQALAQRQFVLHYQPIVDLRRDAIAVAGCIIPMSLVQDSMKGIPFEG